MPLENWVQHSVAAHFLYDWQTLIAGGFAVFAAAMTLGGAEFFARRKRREEIEALRASLVHRRIQKIQGPLSLGHAHHWNR
jgi:hypothetical protein